MINNNFVSFIIPSLGRTTLKKSIQSLLEQINTDWNAIILFDGIDPPQIDGLTPNINYLNDKRFNVIVTEKIGHAGLVRNIGIDLVTSKFIAFLDDDDWVLNTYVERLQSYSNSRPELDIVIFTYKDVTNGNIIPPKKTKDFESCKVGISFAVKTEFIKNYSIKFTPNAIEDFRFLNECRNNGARYLITNDIQYMVGGRGGWLMR